jgi:hypothetical protein
MYLTSADYRLNQLLLLRHPLPHFGDPAQSLQQAHELVRSQPALVQQPRMSSMIVFSMSVSRYGSRKAVSGMLAHGFLQRNSVMMS